MDVSGRTCDLSVLPDPNWVHLQALEGGTDEVVYVDGVLRQIASRTEPVFAG